MILQQFQACTEVLVKLIIAKELRYIAILNLLSSPCKTSPYQCGIVFCIKIACGYSIFTSLKYYALFNFSPMCLVELKALQLIFCDRFSYESLWSRCFCVTYNGQYKRNSFSFGSFYRAVVILLFLSSS